MTGPRQAPVTILVINFHSACNAGDAALLETALAQLQSCFQKAELIVSGNYPDDAYVRSLGVQLVPSPAAIIGLSTKEPLVRQISRMAVGLIACGLVALFPRLVTRSRYVRQNWGSLLTAFQRADLVVSIPGNIFVTMGKFGWAYLVAAVPVGLAYLFRKPFYVMPQSLGPLKRPWERVLLKWLYGRARLVFTREPVSFRLGQELGLPSDRLRRTPDLAFGFDKRVDREAALGLLERLGCTPGRGAVGVTIINQPGARLDREHVARYYSVMADTLARFVKEYGVVLCFFPQVTGPTRFEDDRIPTRRVIERMAVPRNVVFLDQALPPAMLRTLSGFMDAFVATRMHSGIFAVTMGVPTLFIGYLDKTRGVVQDLGIEDWMLELNDLDPDALWKKLTALWQRRESIRENYRTTVPMVASQTLQVAQQIAQDYDSLRR